MRKLDRQFFYSRVGLSFHKIWVFPPRPLHFPALARREAAQALPSRQERRQAAAAAADPRGRGRASRKDRHANILGAGPRQPPAEGPKRRSRPEWPVAVKTDLSPPPQTFANVSFASLRRTPGICHLPFLAQCSSAISTFKHSSQSLATSSPFRLLCVTDCVSLCTPAPRYLSEISSRG